MFLQTAPLVDVPAVVVVVVVVIPTGVIIVIVAVVIVWLLIVAKHKHRKKSPGENYTAVAATALYSLGFLFFFHSSY